MTLSATAVVLITTASIGGLTIALGLFYAYVKYCRQSPMAERPLGRSMMAAQQSRSRDARWLTYGKRVTFMDWERPERTRVTQTRHMYPYPDNTNLSRFWREICCGHLKPAKRIPATWWEQDLQQHREHTYNDGPRNQDVWMFPDPSHGHRCHEPAWNVLLCLVGKVCDNDVCAESGETQTMGKDTRLRRWTFQWTLGYQRVKYIIAAKFRESDKATANRSGGQHGWCDDFRVSPLTGPYIGAKQCLRDETFSNCVREGVSRGRLAMQGVTKTGE